MKMENLKLELEFENGGLCFYKSPTTHPLRSFISYIAFDEYKEIKFVCVIYDNDKTQRYELYEMIPANADGSGIKAWDFERVNKFVDYLNEKEEKVNA